MGAWDCAPFEVLAVVAVFDRLLDTAPFDVVYPMPAPEVATGTAGAGAPQFGLLADYGSTGTPMGITPLFSFLFDGNFRNNGPSLFITPIPGCRRTWASPSASLGRWSGQDGTPFVAAGAIMDGTVGFDAPVHGQASRCPMP